MRATMLVAIALLSNAACSWKGGNWFGLFPAPKFLDGTVVDNRYSPPDRSFTVAVPHPQGSYEYKYMEVREEQDARFTAVKFGPAAFDQGTYSAAVYPRPADMPVLNLAARSADEAPPWLHNLPGPEGAVAHLVLGEHVTLAGRPALFQLWEKPFGEDRMLFVAQYLVALDDNHAGLACGLLPTLPHDIGRVREHLRARTHPVFEPFAASLHLPPPEAAAGR